MAGFGPAPKPNGQRRNQSKVLAQQADTRLPASGRAGRTPKFPLSDCWKEDSECRKRELATWRRLWATPQAVAWETLGWNDVVARYARLSIVVESPAAPAALFSEVRQLEDRLGLTPMAMLRLRWTIVDDSEGQDGAADAAENVLDIRQRVRAVDTAT